MANAKAASAKRRGRVEAAPQLDGEEWLPIEGYPGYEISSLGRVRAIRILNTRYMRGYEHVGLYGPKGRQRNQRINRLVCAAFHGDPNDAGAQAAHLDGDRRNNRADNLAWATQLENENHKLTHGTRWRAGVSRGKLNADQVSTIKALVESGTRQKDVAILFGVSQPTVSQICTGYRWKILDQTGVA